VSEQGGERGFIVVDKRAASGAEEPPRRPQPEPARELPQPDFAALVISLGHSALYHLGLVPDPQTGKHGERNLPIAQQTIDTIEMLQAKTHGNLSAEEAELLENLLYDLRARFVEASK
jgi:hypothetical protein